MIYCLVCAYMRENRTNFNTDRLAPEVLFYIINGKVIKVPSVHALIRDDFTLPAQIIPPSCKLEDITQQCSCLDILLP